MFPIQPDVLTTFLEAVGGHWLNNYSQRNGLTGCQLQLIALSFVCLQDINVI